MQRILLDLLAAELRTEFGSGSEATSLQLFYYWNDTWYSLEASKVEDGFLARNLHATRGHPSKHLRRTRAKDSYYFVEELDAVVQLNSMVGVREPKRERILKAVLAHARHAKAQYESQYDDLTGLWNRKTFQTHAKLILAEQPSPSIGGDEQRDTGESVWLLQLDIDHFKQLNDSYGHAYGDLVLHCFARRLSKLVNDFGSEATSARCARLGGEEFAVLLKGALDRDKLTRFASELSSLGAAEGLPSTAEWQRDRDRLGCNGMQLPHASARAVTASIGLSTLIRGTKTNAEAIYSRLSREADQAVYRAKAGGRNTYRFFNDIRSRLGRVLERHEVTEFVCIDIGDWVDVRKGDEFLVYDADFQGEQHFGVSDGRSTRVYGRRPRLHSATITVLDVQEEISFCTIAKETPRGVVRKGCLLEYVPLGSISHLLGRASGDEWAETIELQEKLLAHRRRNDYVAVATICIRDIASARRESSVAAVNAALVSINSAMTNGFGHSAEIVRISTDTYACLTASHNPLGDFAEKTEKVLATIREELTPSIRVCAGICEPPSPWAELEDSDLWQKVLRVKHAIDYASIAMELARKRGDSCVVFSIHSAAALLHESRRNSQYEVAIRDYGTMRELGIRSWELDNQCALCLWAKGDSSSAQTVFREALNDPDVLPVVRTNFGSLLNSDGSYIEAAEVFETVLATEYKCDSDEVLEAGRALAKASILLGDPQKDAQARALLESLLTHAKASQREVKEAQKLLAELALLATIVTT